MKSDVIWFSIQERRKISTQRYDYTIYDSMRNIMYSKKGINAIYAADIWKDSFLLENRNAIVRRFLRMSITGSISRIDSSGRKHKIERVEDETQDNSNEELDTKNRGSWFENLRRRLFA